MSFRVLVIGGRQFGDYARLQELRRSIDSAWLARFDRSHLMRFLPDAAGI